MPKPVPFNVFTGNLEKDMDRELRNVTDYSNLAKRIKGQVDCKDGKSRSQF